eukprot:742090-Prymnesium_polylepis.1
MTPGRRWSRGTVCGVCAVSSVAAGKCWCASISYYSFSMTAIPNSLPQVRGDGPRGRRGGTVTMVIQCLLNWGKPQNGHTRWERHAEEVLDAQ